MCCFFTYCCKYLDMFDVLFFHVLLYDISCWLVAAILTDYDWKFVTRWSVSVNENSLMNDSLFNIGNLENRV